MAIELQLSTSSTNRVASRIQGKDEHRRQQATRQKCNLCKTKGNTSAVGAARPVQSPLDNEVDIIAAIVVAAELVILGPLSGKKEPTVQYPAMGTSAKGGVDATTIAYLDLSFINVDDD